MAVLVLQIGLCARALSLMRQPRVGFAVGPLRWAVARNAERAAPVAAPAHGRETGVGRAEPSGPRNRMVFFPISSKIGSVYSIKVFS